MSNFKDMLRPYIATSYCSLYAYKLQSFNCVVNAESTVAVGLTYIHKSISASEFELPLLDFSVCLRPAAGQNT